MFGRRFVGRSAGLGTQQAQQQGTTALFEASFRVQFLTLLPRSRLQARLPPARSASTRIRQGYSEALPTHAVALSSSNVSKEGPNASASRAHGPSQMSTGGAYGLSKGASSSHEGKYERDYAQQHGVRKVGLDQRQLSMRVLPSGGTYVCTCSPLMTFENMPRLRLSSTQPLMDLIMSIPLSERGTDNRESSWRPRLDLNQGKRLCTPLRNHSATWP